MRNHRCVGRGTIAVSFGAGLVASFILPIKAVVLILSIALVCLGMSCSRY